MCVYIYLSVYLYTYTYISVDTYTLLQMGVAAFHTYLGIQQ